MAISSCLSCGFSDAPGKDFDDHECADFLALPEVDRRANRDASLRKLRLPPTACEPCAVCGFACSKTVDGLCWSCAQDVGGEGG